MEARNLSEDMGLLPAVTDKSLKNIMDIRNFKRQGTEGLIQCKIKSIDFLLLGDHVDRAANHYIRMLKNFKQDKMD